MCRRKGTHSRIHTSFCDITANSVVFVFLKIVVKATLESVLVEAETFLLVLFYSPCPPPLGMLLQSDTQPRGHSCPTAWTSCFSFVPENDSHCVSFSTNYVASAVLHKAAGSLNVSCYGQTCDTRRARLRLGCPL